MGDYLPDLYQPEEFSEYYKNGFREEYFKETIYEVWENCVVESLKSIYSSVYRTVIFNTIFGLVTTLGFPEILFHWLSASCGIFLLLSTIQSKDGLAIIIGCFIFAYIVLFIKVIFQEKLGTKFKDNNSQEDIHLNCFRSASVIQYSLIAIFILFEYIILEKETWLQIRGVMMVFSMKLISISTDMNNLKKLPNFSQYCGYMFCCGNVLFGPWITFEHYMIQTKYPTKKNFWWLFGITKALLWSVFFLSISNCWANYIIDDNSNRWLVGYKEALSFRTSHYFICYLSEACMLAAGWKELEYHFDDQHWRFPITNFLKIEFPSALTTVVVSWNIPMHKFLKKYIYRKWLPIGKFYAVFLTFVISSLFHGFELKVSTVLISLGIFSYLQILVRDHVSQAFDMCVKVHPCKNCKHKFQRDSIICNSILLVFSIFTVLHLIYLGVLMDQSTDQLGIYQKWSNLHFLSLWIMFINFLIIK